MAMNILVHSMIAFHIADILNAKNMFYLEREAWPIFRSIDVKGTKEKYAQANDVEWEA